MTTTYQQLKKRKVTLPHTVPTVSISVVPRKHGLLVSLRLGFVLVCVVVVFQLLLVPLCKTSTQDVTTSPHVIVDITAHRTRTSENCPTCELLPSTNTTETTGKHAPSTLSLENSALVTETLVHKGCGLHS